MTLRQSTDQKATPQLICSRSSPLSSSFARDHVDWSAELRPDAVIQRLIARPTVPITIRITPIADTSIPATAALTANFRIAPRAIVDRLNPSIIGFPRYAVALPPELAALVAC
jgi:hypothetical protein